MPGARALMAASGLDRVDAQVLLMHVLKVNRAWLLAHDDDALPADRIDSFDRLAQRRRNGEPVAYLVGGREFMGHWFATTPAVLIPRPDTELLVETALQALEGKAAPAVLDLGTGSGAIAVSIALARPDAAVTATDASAEALDVAATNAARLGARVFLRRGDWFGALNETPPAPVYDVIVSNPPYIAANDRHLAEGDLRFEPPGALTDGGDGLAHLRTLAREAGRWLKPGGCLWLEHGWEQAPQVRGLLAQAGLSRVDSRRDLAGIERISGGYL